MLTPCDTKVLYDTHFEAEIAAARHSTPMRVYACYGDGVGLPHYHLTHADPRKQLGHGSIRKFGRCPHCKKLFKRAVLPASLHHCENKPV